MSRRLALPKVVSESMIHIIEPVADQSVRFLIERLGLKKLMKENIYIVSDFRESSKTTDDNHNAKLIDYRVVAKLNPSINPVNNKWEGTKTTIDLGNGNTIVRSSDAKQPKRPWTGHDITDVNYSIFHDEDLYIDLTEWNVASTLQMEIKMDFLDLTPAQETLSKIFATFINGDMMGYIPLQYDYPIPTDQQNVLKYFYKISGRVQTTDKFKEWLTDKSRGCISFNVNRNDTRVQEMVGLRNNAQAFFLIECSQDAPEVSADRYTVNLTMTVQYSRTNRLVLDYPVAANNTLIDINYVPMSPQLRTANKGPFQWQNSAVDEYWKNQYQVTGKFGPIQYPWYDRWVMPGDSIIALKGFKPIFTAVLSLDDTPAVDYVQATTFATGKTYYIKNQFGNYVEAGAITKFNSGVTYYLKEDIKITVLDLKDGLPGYKLSNDVYSKMQESKSKALSVYNTYVNVAVFAHDFQVDPSLLSFDGRYLTIKSRRKEPIYRLVISLNDQPVNMPQINWVWITTIIVKKGN